MNEPLEASDRPLPTLKVFRYIDDLDAFLPTQEFTHLANTLGITEWSPVIWIGRLFMLDNDVGEHWFDNWDEREQLAERARALGFDEHSLLVIVPERFADGRDGPCHGLVQRKLFWTDVLKSLSLSYELLFQEARLMNSQREERQYECELDPVIEDLEGRIARIREIAALALNQANHL